LTGLDLELFNAERARIDRLREMRGDEATPASSDAQPPQSAEARSLR
jgi:hypothetical protein